MTVQERVDAAAALIAYVIHASAGGKGKPEDFVPDWSPPAPVSMADWLHAHAKVVG